MKIRNIVIAGASLAIISSSAFAAQSGPSWLDAKSEGQFDVTGVVPAACVVEVQDLDTILNLWTGETGAKVADIKETCNSGSGYTISFKSDNAGAMANEDDASLKVEYGFNYDTATGQSLAKTVELVRTGLEFQREHVVTVDVGGDYNRRAGIYKDIVTVTIAAN
jgi:spore coat protein U-like protein